MESRDMPVKPLATPRIGDQLIRVARLKMTGVGGSPEPRYEPHKVVTVVSLDENLGRFCCDDGLTYQYTTGMCVYSGGAIPYYVREYEENEYQSRAVDAAHDQLRTRGASCVRIGTRLDRVTEDGSVFVEAWIMVPRTEVLT